MKDNPLAGIPLPSKGDLQTALDSLIMSASGWRKVFAANSAENSLEQTVAPADMFLAAALGRVFAGFLRNLPERPGEDPVKVATVALGMDTRHTGPVLADLIARALIASGCGVIFLGVLPAPEIMAFVKLAKTGQGLPFIRGFVYISASHNPPGHNGVKFGLEGGSVLSAAEIAPLIERYVEFVQSEDCVPLLLRELDAYGQDLLKAAYAGIASWKARSRQLYFQFLRQVITAAPNDETADERWRRMRFPGGNSGNGKGRSPGLLADFNGGARIVSVDRELIGSLACGFSSINDRPGVFAHAIIPEGASLDSCRRELETLYREDPSFILGYVPDCDGDRGNIVYINESTGKAHAMEAQEVFALAVAVECAYVAWLSAENNTVADRLPLAVAANDPTSLRVDALAEAFGAKVFRAEVGEANVVGLARECREKGYEVRILGEGSNGGTIIHPSSVRDPLTTIGSLLKVLTPLSGNDGSSVRGILAKGLGLGMEDDGTWGIHRLVSALPAFVTTGVDEERAKLTIRTADHALLKARFENVFLKAWESRKPLLRESFGINSYREFNYEGTAEKEGFGPAFRSGKQLGGLKIQFYDTLGLAVGFIWMRGSGTEPIFRILADVKGKDTGKERELLSWLTEMIRLADGVA